MSRYLSMIAIESFLYNPPKSCWPALRPSRLFDSPKRFRQLPGVQQDARDPLNGFEAPRARRRLSAAETGFLAYLKKRRRKVSA